MPKTDPGAALAKKVAAAAYPLRSAGLELSSAMLRVRQQQAYTALWMALEEYQKASGEVVLHD